jgi:hypothetical protein
VYGAPSYIPPPFPELPFSTNNGAYNQNGQFPPQMNAFNGTFPMFDPALIAAGVPLLPLHPGWNSGAPVVSYSPQPWLPPNSNFGIAQHIPSPMAPPIPSIEPEQNAEEGELSEGEYDPATDIPMLDIPAPPVQPKKHSQNNRATKSNLPPRQLANSTSHSSKPPATSYPSHQRSTSYSPPSHVQPTPNTKSATTRRRKLFIFK